MIESSNTERADAAFPKTADVIDEDEIFKGLRPFALGVARKSMPRHMQNEFDPEDLVQEALGTIIQFLRNGGTIREMRPYVVKCVLHVVRKYVKKFGRKQRLIGGERTLNSTKMIELDVYRRFDGVLAEVSHIKPNSDDPSAIEPDDMEYLLGQIKTYALRQAVDREIFRLFMSGVLISHIGPQLGQTKNMAGERMQRVWRKRIMRAAEQQVRELLPWVKCH